MITVVNDGPAITSTTYWSTPHAQRKGLLYVSINAGCVRVLVPDLVASLLDDLPPVGTPAELSWSLATRRVDLALLDDPESPWVADLPIEQADRRPPPEDEGRVLALVWYRRADSEGVREVRRETVTIRRGP